MLLHHSGIILLLIFLLVTYIISSFEKIFAWKQTYNGFCDLFKNTLSPIVVLISSVIILGIEIILSTIIVIALFKIVTEQSLLYAQYSFILSNILILILLVGLRIAKDFDGASRLGIYFIIGIAGLFWSQYI
ncbi:hypothetical protein [uncultured Nonlabens sp.]|uniref:hypothetical protein n=1 Tax=uncultured Nonlabens sp. TaxID=859306 RepID=UPI00263413C3|nr:hypothetical protein [uncultured Nonlabens sp.]